MVRLLDDAENGQFLWYSKFRVRIKLRSRSHLAVIAQCACIFPIFYTFSNRIQIRGRRRSRHRRRMEAAWWLEHIHIYCIVPYRIIGRCESILHRHCEHFTKICIKWNKKRHTRINNNASARTHREFWTETETINRRKNKPENHTRLFSMTRLLFGRRALRLRIAKTLRHRCQTATMQTTSQKKKKNRIWPNGCCCCCCDGGGGVALAATATAGGSNCCLFSLCTSISRYKSDNIAFLLQFCFSFFLFSFRNSAYCALRTRSIVRCGWWLFVCTHTHTHSVPAYVQIVEHRTKEWI